MVGRPAGEPAPSGHALIARPCPAPGVAIPDVVDDAVSTGGIPLGEGRPGQIGEGNGRLEHVVVVGPLPTLREPDDLSGVRAGVVAARDSAANGSDRPGGSWFRNARQDIVAPADSLGDHGQAPKCRAKLADTAAAPGNEPAWRGPQRQTPGRGGPGVV